MSPRLGALTRTVALLGLFAYSAFDDTLPRWWWGALVLVLIWTLIDFMRWHEGWGEEDD